MATKIGDLYFEVTADTSSARSALLGMGGAATEAAGIIGGVVATAFGAIALAATTAVVAATAEVVKLGAAFNAASQQAMGLFTALTGSAEDALDIMREFAQIALDSPIFNAGQLQRTTSLLLTFGIAQEEALDLAKNIELAAIALDRGTVGAHQLARAIGQIQGRGWLEGDEARQLSEVGVNAYAVIAEAAGLTTAEVMKLGREHKLLAEDVIPVLTAHLEETFGPVGQSLLNTYGVQVQGLKNVMTGFGSALVDPFISRTGGGVIVDFLQDIRGELDGLITVAADGSYELIGALEPLNDLTQALADGFAEIGDAIIGVAATGLQSGAIGDFATGLADVIPDLVDTIEALSIGAGQFLSDMGDAIAPLLPSLGHLFEILYDFVVEALPLLAEGLVDLVRAAAPIAAEFLEMANAVLEFASPVLIDLLTAVADTLEIIADVVQVLSPFIDDMVAIWVGWKIAIIAADIATASFVTITLSGLSTMLLTIASYAGVALAALGAFKGLEAGLTGDIGWLNEDRPFYEKPFQMAGRFGYALGGGDREAVGRLEDIEEAEAAAESFNLTLLAGVDTFEEARAGAEGYAEALGISGEALLHFGNIVATAWQADADAAEAARQETVDLINEYERWAARGDSSAGGTLNLQDDLEEEIDLMKELTTAAKMAWEAVDQLMRPSSDATIDDFLRDLPKLAEDLTDALSEAPSILRDLNVGGALQKVEQDALKVIRTLAVEYGMSMDEIQAYFGANGLAGVIEVLGTLTEETTETVDPLVAKYSQLGATAEQLNEAISQLEEQRTTALRAQIDQVEAALRDAKVAAEEAREAVRDFVSGDYLDSPQELVDDLIGGIGNIGSTIEDALRQGGVRGEAAIRGALGDVQSDIADIINAGLEAGLSGQEIVGLLGPVMTALEEETRDARNRISSLDWTEGFTPGAAQTIADMLGGILDPTAIQSLINNILGADATVAGLEDQLESLNARMNTEVEFSPEQVQGALDAIESTIVTEPIVTPEAAQMVYDVIQGIFENEDLEAAVDQALITQQILDAAKAAEDSINLVFDSSLSFDSVQLSTLARQVGDEFYTNFQNAIRDQQAMAAGFDSYYDLQRALGPNVAAAIAPGTDTPGSNTQTIQIDAPITIQGSVDPIRTGTETVAAMSAAAGSGGALSRSLQDIYGVEVIPGFRGPQ